MRTHLAVTAFALLAAAAFAGPLNPPAGAVGASMKTLVEVEPRTAINATNTPGDSDSVYKISQPGSYYLTGNILGIAGKCGIEVNASHVTIDLNGFSLFGVDGTLDGIRSQGGGRHDVTIYNGTVAGFAGDGIDLSTADIGIGGSIHDVHTRFNGGTGIVTNAASVLERCTSYLNGAMGYQVRYDTTVSGCTAINNGTIGFGTGGNCSVSRCTADSNGGDGFNVGEGGIVANCTSRSSGEDGIQVGISGAVEHCVLQFNATDGVRAGSFATIRDNTCDSNGLNGTGAGIHVTGTDCRIEGNACNNADFGVDIDNGGNFVVKNTCANNTVNWSISLNNLYGPIVERTGPVAPAVNGNTAASVLTSTDPNANFTH